MNKHVKPSAARVPTWARDLPGVLNAGPSSNVGMLAFTERFGPACEGVEDWSLKHHHVLREALLALRPHAGDIKVLVTAAARAHRQAGTGKDVSDQTWRDIMADALAASGNTVRQQEVAAAEAVRAAIWAARRSDNPRSLAEGIEDTIICARRAAVASAGNHKDRVKDRLRTFGDDLRSRVVAALGE